jgi:hypothetical protein
MSGLRGRSYITGQCELEASLLKAKVEATSASKEGIHFHNNVTHKFGCRSLRDGTANLNIVQFGLNA